MYGKIYLFYVMIEKVVGKRRCKPKIKTVYNAEKSGKVGF